MANVLLINPSYEPSYGGAKAGIVNPIHPTLGLATIAAVARERGHHIEILDLSWRPYDTDLIRDRIKAIDANIVGVTATTPLMNQLRDISVFVKDISRDILVVGGGSHPSALPEETLRESMLDIVFTGEADFTFADICDGLDPKDVRGLYYRDGDQIKSTGMRPPLENLDDLPMPAWDLYDPEDYKQISRLLCRRPPISMVEFSRGCVFKCDFCASKITMALGYRKKSPERCAAELVRLYELGYREVMLADDIFTSDQKWASDVCQAIIDSGVDMAWSCTNGIRVESADDELFQIMRKAGCYRVSFGFESGNDAVLKAFGKGGRAAIEQGRWAVNAARRAGIDTNGFFLLGLSPDTEDTMEDTIEYARQLPLDMMKFGISIAFPGTPVFNKYSERGLIRSYNWDEYYIYTDDALFAHERLDYRTIQAFMDKAYKRAILYNPSFVIRRMIRGIRTGEFFWDMYYGIKFFTAPAVSKSTKSIYYAEDRWPQHDFEKNELKAASYQIVRKPGKNKAKELAEDKVANSNSNAETQTVAAK